MGGWAEASSSSEEEEIRRRLCKGRRMFCEESESFSLESFLSEFEEDSEEDSLAGDECRLALCEKETVGRNIS